MVHYPHQQLAQAAIVGGPIVAAVFVGLRLYARWRSNLRLRSDDWTIIAAVVSSLALTGPSWQDVKIWHVGMHIWQVPGKDWFPQDRDSYAVELGFLLLYIPILPLVKASMILLLLRLGAVLSWTREMLCGLLIFTIVCGVVPWCICIFICPPRAGDVWAPRTFGNLHCLSREQYGHLLIALTSANLLTDILIFPIPFMIVRRLTQANIRSRVLLVSVFTISIAVTAVGAAKLGLAIQYVVKPKIVMDWTYNIEYCLNHVESNVAILMANVPILHSLFAQRTYKSNSRAEEFYVKPSGSDHNEISADSNGSSTKDHAIGVAYTAEKKLMPFHSATWYEEEKEST